MNQMYLNEGLFHFGSYGIALHFDIDLDLFYDSMFIILW